LVVYVCDFVFMTFRMGWVHIFDSSYLSAAFSKRFNYSIIIFNMQIKGALTGGGEREQEAERQRDWNNTSMFYSRFAEVKIKMCSELENAK